MCNDVSEALDRAPVRSILPERNMRTRPIIIGGEDNRLAPRGTGTAPISAPEDEPARGRSASRMSKEEAERLRALLRDTNPAALWTPSARQRVGEMLVEATRRGVRRKP